MSSLAEAPSPMGRQFKLRYLPLFERDLAAARDYIADRLRNPSAALRLLEETEAAILRRLAAPCVCAPYLSDKKRRHPYYRIYVLNFTVFYVVIGEVMEVRRFLYSKRELANLV